MGVLYDTNGNALEATDGRILLDTGNITGSQADLASRLRALLPRGWFPDAPAEGETEPAPVLAGMLAGFASVFAWSWSLLSQVGADTRLSTMTGPFLDMAADDFFGSGQFSRNDGETDESYLARIKAALVAKKNTRAAVEAALTNARATSVRIIECWNAEDCGAYMAASATRAHGGYGSASLRYSGAPGQFFIETAVTDAALPVVRQSVIRAKASGALAWMRNTAPSS